MENLHISLSAEEIFKIPFGAYEISVTNSLFTGWVVTLIVSLILLSIISTLQKRPTSSQNLFEIIYLFIYSTIRDVTGTKLADRLFPLFFTIFLFIVFGSWVGLLPGAGTLGFIEDDHGHEKVVPIFRAVTADLNTTFALGLIAFLVIEINGLRELKLSYLTKFFNFSSPINFIVGLLELFSEFVRILSFSLRLFGNIFAGEVIIAVMLSLAGFLVIPFLLLEVSVGLIQAFVFVMLMAVFIRLATESHESADH